ncbi:hypothetical protein [Aequorivita capsosiphonis]|uniref:hypothetical protein n=1 Tax=Aequorivita capsosiphonis TaxID=487317 RepID=UPI00041BB890|nr:hypothetical protein [Aequorivita capsosiphonis]
MGKGKTERNWLEWAISILSGILVCFTLGFLAYQLIFEEQTPPNIRVVLGEVSQKDEAFAVPLEAFNKGTETAENVVIEVVLDEESDKEKGQITFEYLPGKSSVTGWVIFTKKPLSKRLKAHVIGYSTP